MELVLLATLVALGMKVVDFVKSARTGDVNGCVTQLSVWAAGVGVVFLGSASDFATTVDINGMLLNDLNSASKVLLGLSLLSAGMVANDFRKAIDNTDSAKTNQLVPPKS